MDYEAIVVFRVIVEAKIGSVFSINIITEAWIRINVKNAVRHLPYGKTVIIIRDLETN